ncbi:MAG TPA: GNAT family N-acetyltransferase [Mycobacteriales bacterium]|nr:GNAT family N-acetyltransferase [Mycobacteriales bacterium]
MIRDATVDDVPVIVSLVRELAAYEREPDAAVATEDDYRSALFGDRPRAWCLLAEDDSGDVVGFALWFFNFSTWRGRHGVYLEDLFVRPEARGGGHGRALLAELARIAVGNDCARMEWVVLDWNESAHGFYRALGAAPMDEWTVWRLTGEDLDALASGRSLR